MKIAITEETTLAELSAIVADLNVEINAWASGETYYVRLVPWGPAQNVQATGATIARALHGAILKYQEAGSYK